MRAVQVGASRETRGFAPVNGRWLGLPLSVACSCRRWARCRNSEDFWPVPRSSSSRFLRSCTQVSRLRAWSECFGAKNMWGDVTLTDIGREREARRDGLFRSLTLRYLAIEPHIVTYPMLASTDRSRCRVAGGLRRPVGDSSSAHASGLVSRNWQVTKRSNCLQHEVDTSDSHINRQSLYDRLRGIALCICRPV